MQMQNQLSSAESGFDILKKPGHLLSFVKHALETAVQKPAERTTSAKPKAENGLKLEDLRIVDVEEDDEENVEGDSDDEDEPSAPREGSDEEMTSTALNLLLSILEGMHRASFRSTRNSHVVSQSGPECAERSGIG